MSNAVLDWLQFHSSTRPKTSHFASTRSPVDTLELCSGAVEFIPILPLLLRSSKSELVEITRRKYADDKQLFARASKSEVKAALRKLCQCTYIDSSRPAFYACRIQPNTSKTEWALFDTRSNSATSASSTRRHPHRLIELKTKFRVYVSPIGSACKYKCSSRFCNITSWE